MATADSVIIDFKLTGINTVDVDKVASQWNHLWFIAQWKDEYRLIKYRRKDSPATVLKTDISKEQAQELISKLNLVAEPQAMKSATSWRQSKN